MTYIHIGKVFTFSSTIEKAPVIKTWIISSIFYDKYRCLSKSYLLKWFALKLLPEKIFFNLSFKKQTNLGLYNNILLNSQLLVRVMLNTYNE